MSNHAVELFVGWMAVIGMIWSVWQIFKLITNLIEYIWDKVVYK